MVVYIYQRLYEVIINNVIYNNTAETFGGGIYIDIAGNTIINNSIVGNSANSIGGGIYIHSPANTFINNILWDNKLDTETNVPDADLFLTSNNNTFFNNILQLDSTTYIGTNFSLNPITQGNLFAQNPMFLNITNPQGEDLIYLTGDDGLRLQTNSPAINAGTLTNAPETDILGTPRDVLPDIGAYEHGVFVGIQPNTNSNPPPP